MSASFTKKLNCIKQKLYLYHCSLRGRSSNTGGSTPLEYCIDLVKKFDCENFFCTLYLPKDLRPVGIAIRAFNVEVAMVQDHVTETIIGKMRYQFWEDTIEKLYAKNVPSHPVCIQLAKAINAHNLSKRYLKKLISARRKLLQSPTFHSMADVEEYADAANTPIFLLLLEAAEIKNIDCDHAASHLGKAQGIANMMRSVIYYNRKNTVQLPQDLLLSHNVSHEHVLRHNTNKSMKDLTFDMASRINFHLKLEHKMEEKMERKNRRIFLSSVPIRMYLENLRAVDFDIFHPTLQRRNNLLSLKLLWNRITRY